MEVRAKGPLTIDGVALGATRREVESQLGRGTTNANPAWARYYPDGRLGGQAALPVLVSFLPAWPEREFGAWRVQSLCGSVLRKGKSLLLSVGDPIVAVTAVLGLPEEVFYPEPGLICTVFGGCLVTHDEHSARVVEISLRFPSTPAKLSEHAPAVPLLDDALAS